MRRWLGVPAFSAAAAALLSPAFAQDAKLIERGAYLMNGIVACGNCHVARGPGGRPIPERGLSGGMVFDEQPFKAFASNITPDPDTGIGKWTDAQLARAIREGIRPDGTVIGPPMPFLFYRGIADDDLAAIIAYLRAQPPVRNAVPKSEYRIPLPPAYGPPIQAPVAAPPRSDTVRYGEYLAGPLGHCMECHTPWDAKGHPDMSRLGAGGNPFRGPWGVSVSRNITPHETGLKGWTDEEIARAIQQAVRKDGTPLKPPMAYDWYRNIDNADMSALIAYLRSLRPLPFAAPPNAKN
ncbi:MAG TPA: c-type cytochrome [Burkholderiaceae bacterium]|nr:c-type cytochrome [Burkholderiaceae bacterium]